MPARIDSQDRVGVFGRDIKISPRIEGEAHWTRSQIGEEGPGAARIVLHDRAGAPVSDIKIAAGIKGQAYRAA